MANSIQQTRDIEILLALMGEALNDRPLLLVDDMANTRSTLTLETWLLRSKGSSEVWPLALV